MVRKNPLAAAVNRALYGVAAVTTATIPALTQAQDDGAPAALEEITVTGSRIATDANLVTSSPVSTVRPEEIGHRGITRVEDLVNDLPQIVPELTSTESNGATGTATLDLRGLTSVRTLVLTNGHRMGFGDPFALAPDVNQIPGALIERVELLTGGASSTYGSDAVAGVVNFIMKSDFEGFQLDFQVSGYDSGDDNTGVQADIDAAGFEQGGESSGTSQDINLIVGVNSGDGRGNVTGYMGYRSINAIKHGDRDFSACALSSNSADGTGCGGSATIPTGLFTPFNGVDYFTVAGDQFVPWDYTYYNYGPLNFFQRPDERFTGGAFGHYEIAPALEGYAEFMFMDDQSDAQIAPSGAFFVTSTIPCENPLLSPQQFGVLGCTSTADIAPFYIGRRNVEGGPRNQDLRHTSFRSLAGFRGDFGNGWSYDFFANFSRLNYSNVYENDLSITRIGRALDVVDDGMGNPVCRSVVDGSDPACVPWNLFQTGGVTDAAINYLVLPLFANADLDMNQVVGYVAGDLTDYGVVIPTASDGLQVVFGAEYRDESFNFVPDFGYTSGDGAGQGGPIPAVSGELWVKEFFTELKVPIVQDRPGIRSLSLDLRYRFSDYETDVDTDTWNIGGEYTPIDGLMFRGGISRAVRHANISELFTPQALGLWAGTDPCAGAMPELSAAQCANSGVTAAQYGSIPVSPAGQYNRITGGNPDLVPEESDSTTVGFVFTPSGFAEGLTLSVDYWSIEVEDAIATGIGEEFTIRECGATGDAAFCSLISRGPNGNLWIGGANVLSTQVNIGFFDTAGYDVAGTYSMDVGRHGLDFNLRTTYLDKFDQQPVPGAPTEECAGQWGGSCTRPRPEWKTTFSTNWTPPGQAFRIGASLRYISAMDEFALDRFTAGSKTYIDMSANWMPDWGWGNTEFNAGVTNITDNDPPVNGLINNVSVYSNGNTIPGTWDALGRYWFVGFRQGFGEG